MKEKRRNNYNLIYSNDISQTMNQWSVGNYLNFFVVIAPFSAIIIVELLVWLQKMNLTSVYVSRYLLATWHDHHHLSYELSTFWESLNLRMFLRGRQSQMISTSKIMTDIPLIKILTTSTTKVPTDKLNKLIITEKRIKCFTSWGINTF